MTSCCCVHEESSRLGVLCASGCAGVRTNGLARRGLPTKGGERAAVTEVAVAVVVDSAWVLALARTVTAAQPPRRCIPKSRKPSTGEGL